MFAWPSSWTFALLFSYWNLRSCFSVSVCPSAGCPSTHHSTQPPGWWWRSCWLWMPEMPKGTAHLSSSVSTSHPNLPSDFSCCIMTGGLSVSTRRNFLLISFLCLEWLLLFCLVSYKSVNVPQKDKKEKVHSDEEQRKLLVFLNEQGLPGTKK